MLFSEQVFLILLILIFGWLGTLTFFLFKYFIFFRNITKGVNQKDLKAILEETIEELRLAKTETKKIINKIENLEQENRYNFQKIGLVRYNPFSDTGGDQSFVLALLDGNDNGVVITSLHSREQTRIFTKPVENGKEKGYEFSKEEIEAILKAKKGRIKK